MFKEFPSKGLLLLLLNFRIFEANAIKKKNLLLLK